MLYKKRPGLNPNTIREREREQEGGRKGGREIEKEKERESEKERENTKSWCKAEYISKSQVPKSSVSVVE